MNTHRVDEYLQATTIQVAKDRVQAEIHLTPGIAIYPVVFAAIDTDRDGAISVAEERAYAERVLRGQARFHRTSFDLGALPSLAFRHTVFCGQHRF